MSKQYIKPGEALDYTNHGANPIPVDSIVAIGAMIAVAAVTILPGATGTVLPTGVFTLPKKAGTAAPVGTKLNFVSADQALEVGGGAAGDVANGAIVVEQDAAAGDTMVRVLLCPGMGSVVA